MLAKDGRYVTLSTGMADSSFRGFLHIVMAKMKVHLFIRIRVKRSHKKKERKREKKRERRNSNNAQKMKSDAK